MIGTLCIAQGWKFFTKAKQWESDPAISVTGKFSKDWFGQMSRGQSKSFFFAGFFGVVNHNDLELEEADIMHVGKAVEERREGLYIRSVSITTVHNQSKAVTTRVHHQ